MKQYFFILGRNAPLSLAEITSVLSHLHINYLVKNLSQEVVILETEGVLESLDLMDTLGGTIKLGEVINKVNLDEDELQFENIFSAKNLLANFLSKKEGKLHIGISIYSAGCPNQYISRLFTKLKYLNTLVKENLREKGLRAGFVKVKERSLSSVSVFKNQLIERGVEIVLILTNEKILVGKTLAVQEFEEFSFRDIYRPKKDKRSGIMPPKLARIMINLAEIEKKDVLLDPFCGSGTILQEGVVMGYKNIIGSDISGKAISDTRQNLNWLFRYLKTPRLWRGGGENRELVDLSCNIKLWEIDVRFLDKKIPVNSVDAIVTEPYLGPPLYKKPDTEGIKKTLLELEKLYQQAFSQFFKILKPGGKVVIIFPVFERPYNLKKATQTFKFLDILDKIKKMGFSQKEFFHKDLQNKFSLSTNNRNSIIYGNTSQFVKREILIFQK